MTRGRLLAAIAVAWALLAGGCSASAPSPARPASSAAGTQPAPDGRYAQLVDDLRAKGAGVWVESDVVKAYQAGPERYHQVLGIVLNHLTGIGLRTCHWQVCEFAIGPDAHSEHRLL